MESTNITKQIREVRIEKRESQKTGKPYNVCIIRLVNDYEINVFLERAEIKLIDLLNKQDEQDKGLLE